MHPKRFSSSSLQSGGFIRTGKVFGRSSVWVKSGWPLYERRRNRTLREIHLIQPPLVLSSNGLVAQKVMLARVLGSCMKQATTDSV